MSNPSGDIPQTRQSSTIYRTREVGPIEGDEPLDTRVVRNSAGDPTHVYENGQLVMRTEYIDLTPGQTWDEETETAVGP